MLEPVLKVIQRVRHVIPVIFGLFGISIPCGLFFNNSDNFPKYLDKAFYRSEEHTSELQSLTNLVCRLLLEKKKKNKTFIFIYSSINKYKTPGALPYPETIDS